MPKSIDKISACVEEIKKVARKHNVILFSVEVGDDETLDSYKRIESWAKYCRRMRQGGLGVRSNSDVVWSGGKSQVRV